MKVLGFVVALTACSFQSSPSEQPTDSSGQAPVDAAGSDVGKMDAPPVIPPDASQCFGGGLLKLCLKKLPTGQRTFNTSTFDTSTDANCTEIIAQANGPELCVVTAEQITVAGALTAIGARALVLLASDTFEIPTGGVLDVSSRVANGGRKGAAANTGTCSTLGHGTNDEGGAGGGAGGSFGSLGGAGGIGDTNNNGLPVGTAPGAPAGATQTAPTVLRGGCAGSAGGDGSNSNATVQGPPGGDGGGAVYVIAAAAIKIDGDVFASGAGGGARTNATGIKEGGGGGGAGGMIGLDAPVLTIAGRIAANGGSGGGGGSRIRGGQVGNDGSTTQWNVRPGGGQGDRDRDGDGGDGARGAVINGTDNMTGANSIGGGGGAGGGFGLVWTWGTVNGGTMISPAPVKKPQA